jgi:hypothetical protein
MTIVAIGNYELKCEECKVTRLEVGFDIDMVYLYANQYKTKIRQFCHRCGAVHDVTIKEGYQPIIEKRSMRASIFGDINYGIHEDWQPY